MRTFPAGDLGPEVLLDLLRRDPYRVVIRTPSRNYSSYELRGWVLGISAELANSRGTVAVLTAANSPLILVARYAAHLNGRSIICIRSENARSDADELPLTTQQELLRAAEVSTLVVDSQYREQAQYLVQRMPDLQVITASDNPIPSRPVEFFAPVRRNARDLAVVDLTSGSSFGPKLVGQSFAGWNNRIRRALGDSPPQKPTNLLCVTPISHSNATMIDAALLRGGTIEIHPGWDPDLTMSAIVSGNVTDLYLAVPYLTDLVELASTKMFHGSALRQILYSGTPAAPHRIMQALSVFSDTLTQLYGSTEAGGITCLTPLDHAEPELLSSVGRPFSWVELSILDPTGTSLPAGEIGEVCVRSDTAMQGYLDPELADPRWPDGWLRTGDLGRYDPYGYLHLLGRLGNVFKTHGIKVHPETVEQAVCLHPGVRNVVSYVARDSDLRESLLLVVERQPNNDCTSEELVTLISQGLSPAHVPQSIEFVTTIPRTITGKPDRELLFRRGNPTAVIAPGKIR
jgi:fatty-acyl-CoA synthase